MKLSYRFSVFIFFMAALLPIVAFWYAVEARIEQRQLTLQLFLQNQIDVDRKILNERAILRSVSPQVRSFLLKTDIDGQSEKQIAAFLKESQDELEKFWKKYETDYTASQRSFLLSVLKETQEMNLVEEEQKVVAGILRKIGAYFFDFSSYLPSAGNGSMSFSGHIDFLEEMDGKRENIYDSINELFDIRYIYSQRMVFVVSGENDRQSGFFSLVFAVIAFVVIITSILEYFFIHKPVKDIMLFLRDLAQGKRGQRLYFSSPIREIKESEDIINAFVSEAEEHQKE